MLILIKLDGALMPAGRQATWPHCIVSWCQNSLSGPALYVNDSGFQLKLITTTRQTNQLINHLINQLINGAT